MDVFEFIKDEFDKSRHDLTLNMSLRKDLDLDGDEAYDFIVKFSEVFDVDIREFEFKKYFNGESDKISLWIFSLFFGDKKKILTVNDLKKAIANKKLI